MLLEPQKRSLGRIPLQALKKLRNRVQIDRNMKLALPAELRRTRAAKGSNSPKFRQTELFTQFTQAEPLQFSLVQTPLTH